MNEDSSVPNEHDPLLNDVDVDVFRGYPSDPSSSGVKLTHRPTGIEVVSTTETTQLANRARALTMLRKRLGDDDDGSSGTREPRDPLPDSGGAASEAE